MIFRGDGNSNIYEGNTFDNFFFKEGTEIKRIKRKEYEAGIDNGKIFERFITRTLMNPPFALSEQEFTFVDHALLQMADGGLLLAVLPASTMSSTSDGRGEITWRSNLLKRHTLKAVVKLSEDLFLPNAHKGTYIVVIEAWKPHGNKKTFWAIMDDGFTMKKAKRLPSNNIPSNMSLISESLQAFLILDKAPQEVEKVIGFKEIEVNDPTVDCGAEAYLNSRIDKDIDLASTTSNLFKVLLHNKRPQRLNLRENTYELVKMGNILDSVVRGDCRSLNQLKSGEVPVITTTEENNGVDGFYDVGNATIFKDTITIPANGSKYRAFYHPYDFTAVSDILVCQLKPEFSSLEAKLFICSVINQSSWRFSYFRKCNEQKIRKDVQIALPIRNGKLDIEFIRQSLEATPSYQGIKEMLNI